MDTPPIKTRARALVHQIHLFKPDVVLLQEVTAETLPVLTFALAEKKDRPTAGVNDVDGEEDADAERKDLEKPEQVSGVEASSDTVLQPTTSTYTFHIGDTWADDLPYFPLLLTRSGLFRDASVDTTAVLFPASRMHRGYICTSGELTECGLRVAFLTSHLESLKESTKFRQAQLFRIFDRQRELVEKGVITIFGGDTNLREAEVPASEVVKTVAAEKKRQEGWEAPAKRRRVGAKEKLVDAWLAAGAEANEKFTWDTFRNDNLQFDAEFKPRARYDRVFMLWPKDMDVQVPSLKLVGKERLPSCGKFISDHWGVCVDLLLRG